MLKKLGLSIAALIASVAIAYSAGMFNGFPIVGDPGNTLCFSFGNNGVCNQFSPVGPTSVPPTAVVPADTNSNTQPFSINIPAGLTGATVLDNAPLTGASITIPVGTAKLILNPAGTIATLTVVLPALATNPLDGQEFSIYSTQTVTALTVTPGTGTTLTPTITTVTAAAPVKLLYIGATKAWQLQ